MSEGKAPSARSSRAPRRRDARARSARHAASVALRPRGVEEDFGPFETLLLGDSVRRSRPAAPSGPKNKRIWRDGGRPEAKKGARGALGKGLSGQPVLAPPSAEKGSQTRLAIVGGEMRDTGETAPPPYASPTPSKPESRSYRLHFRMGRETITKSRVRSICKAGKSGVHFTLKEDGYI